MPTSSRPRPRYPHTPAPPAPPYRPDSPSQTSAHRTPRYARRHRHRLPQEHARRDVGGPVVSGHPQRRHPRRRVTANGHSPIQARISHARGSGQLGHRHPGQLQIRRCQIAAHRPRLHAGLPPASTQCPARALTTATGLSRNRRRAGAEPAGGAEACPGRKHRTIRRQTTRPEYQPPVRGARRRSSRRRCSRHRRRRRRGRRRSSLYRRGQRRQRSLRAQAEQHPPPKHQPPSRGPKSIPNDGIGDPCNPDAPNPAGGAIPPGNPRNPPISPCNGDIGIPPPEPPPGILGKLGNPPPINDVNGL